MPSIKQLPIKKKRVRWLTQEEVLRLLNELPPHLNAMMRFTLATGLRESNITKMQWKQIDESNCHAWIYADQAKGKEDISIPLNDDALAVLAEQKGINEKYVFTYKGEPVTRANNHAWRKALKRAGIEDFRWHDLRKTWASWHRINGTPLDVIQELAAWSSYEMVEIYAFLSSDYLQQYAGNVSLNSDIFTAPIKKA